MRSLIERLRAMLAPRVIEPHPTRRFLDALTEHAAVERLGHPAR